MFTEGKPLLKPKPILDKHSIQKMQQHVKEMPIANNLREAAVKIVIATRKSKKLFLYGASPRASMALILSAKARALIRGRSHVSSEDIREMALPVLRHRVILDFEAERKGITVDEAIRQIIK